MDHTDVLKDVSSNFTKSQDICSSSKTLLLKQGYKIQIHTHKSSIYLFLEAHIVQNRLKLKLATVYRINRTVESQGVQILEFPFKQFSIFVIIMYHIQIFSQRIPSYTVWKIHWPQKHSWNTSVKSRRHHHNIKLLKKERKTWFKYIVVLKFMNLTAHYFCVTNRPIPIITEVYKSLLFR